MGYKICMSWLMQIAQFWLYRTTAFEDLKDTINTYVFLYEWPLKILPVFLQKACLSCSVTCWLQIFCPLIPKLAIKIHCKISCLLMDWAWRSPYLAAVELAQSPYLSSMSSPKIPSPNIPSRVTCRQKQESKRPKGSPINRQKNWALLEMLRITLISIGLGDYSITWDSDTHLNESY